jgi:hypothetical protein
MQQVKDSPDIDTDIPVSRRMEADVFNYYGGEPYWGGGLIPMSNAIATPLVGCSRACAIGAAMAPYLSDTETTD